MRHFAYAATPPDYSQLVVFYQFRWTIDHNPAPGLSGPSPDYCTLREGQMTDLSITDIKLRLVDAGTDGLIAWASCVVAHAIKLDNIAIRRGRDNSLFLTYPIKRTDAGDKYPYFNPISSEASKAVEDAVVARLAALARAAAACGPEQP
jgi:DNA-binding cell septation regulator SpoVG